MNALGGQGRALWRSYEHHLRTKPVLVQMTTSAVLWGLGDVLAQRIEHKKGTPLDKRRLLLTSGFGASFMGPVGHYWYSGLDAVASKLVAPGTGRFLAVKLLADTFLLGPVYVMAFYAYGSYIIDRTGWGSFKEKMQKDFIPTFMAELAIWPVFQTFNFTKIPVAHQLLAVNCMTLVDASFLSWARNQSDWVGTALGMIGVGPKQEQPDVITVPTFSILSPETAGDGGMSQPSTSSSSGSSSNSQGGVPLQQAACEAQGGLVGEGEEGKGSLQEGGNRKEVRGGFSSTARRKGGGVEDSGGGGGGKVHTG